MRWSDDMLWSEVQGKMCERKTRRIGSLVVILIGLLMNPSVVFSACTNPAQGFIASVGNDQILESQSNATSLQYTFDCSITSQTPTSPITWSIVSGSAYASISAGGILTSIPVPVGQNQSIQIQARDGANITALKTITLVNNVPTLDDADYGAAGLGPVGGIYYLNKDTYQQTYHALIGGINTPLTSASGLVWSVNTSGGASINGSGVLNTNGISSNQVVNVSATYTYTPVVGSATYSHLAKSIAVNWPSMRARARLPQNQGGGGPITFSGPDGTVGENSSTPGFGATIYWNDNTSQAITPNWSVNYPGASVTSGGVLVVPSVTQDENIIVTGSFNLSTDTIHGFSTYYPEYTTQYSVQFPLTILNADIILTGLSVSPPSGIASLDENNPIGYKFKATATFDDGTTSEVIPDTWSVNSSFASIDDVGVLTTLPVSSNQTVLVSASFTYLGVTKSANHSIVINNSNKKLIGLTIGGPATVSELDTEQYTATVQYDDGSTAVVDSAFWGVSGSESVGVCGNGLLTSSYGNGNQVVELSATYSANGTTVTGRKSVTVTSSTNDSPSMRRASVSCAGVQANGASSVPSISSDGRFIAFASTASNLVNDDTNGVADVFVHDRLSGVTEQISVDNEGVGGELASDHPSISADGNHVAFSSLAGSLIPIGANGHSHIYVRERNTGLLERVSVSSDNNDTENDNEGNGDSLSPSISADGRFVAFESGADNLLASSTDTNGVSDIFVRDRQRGTTERISIGLGGVQANGASMSPSISADGRYVAFASDATNLVSDDVNGVRDVFIYDRETGVTGWISENPYAAFYGQSYDSSDKPALSSDGRYAVFVSGAGNLNPVFGGAYNDIYFRDRIGNGGHALELPITSQAYSVFFKAKVGAGIDTTLLFKARHADGNPPSGSDSESEHNVRLWVSAYDENGALIQRVSGPWSPVAYMDHILYPEWRAVTRSYTTPAGTDYIMLEWLSQARATQSGAYWIDDVSVNVGATILASEDFESEVLGNEWSLGQSSVVAVSPSGFTERISAGSLGYGGDGNSLSAAISGDGRYIAYASDAANLASDDTNAMTDIFVYDRQLRTTSRVSVNNASQQGNGASIMPAISADGKYITFASDATNLGVADSNGVRDIYVRPRVENSTGTSRVWLEAANSSVPLGQNVAADLYMDFSNDPTLGGGIDIEYDSNSLSFVSFEADPALGGDPSFRRSPDVLSLELNGAAFGEFNGLAGPLRIGSVTFDTLNAGITNLAVASNDAPMGGFYSANTQLSQAVNFSGATITIGDSTSTNQPPVLSAIGTRTVTEGEMLSFAVSADDADGPAPLMLSASSTLPGNPVILTDHGDGTGTVSWTPAIGDAAGSPYSVTVTAMDGAGAIDIETFAIEVGAQSGSNPTLTGTSAAVPTTVNLTTEGTADWAHWGLTNASSFNHKSGVTQQISNFTPFGTTALRFAGNPAVWPSHSWSDGTPTASSSGTPALVYFLGAGNGYEFTVPADTTQRTLRVYLGSSKALSQVEFSLSDNSATPYVTTIDATGSTAVPKLITVTYRAGSAGQTLKVRHTLTTDYGSGNILLQAASLQVNQAPVNQPPVLSPIGDRTVTEGQTLSLSVSASDADGPAPLTLSATSTLPGNPSILTDHGNGSATLNWASVLGNAANSPYSVTVTATDGSNATASETFEVEVLPLGSSPLLSANAVAIPATASLTTEGTADWAHWGLTNASSFNHKSGVTQQISNFTPIGTTALRSSGNAAVWTSHSWSDGTPTASASATPVLVYFQGAGKGYEFTAPADTTLRTLRVYLGGSMTLSKVEISLSDNSTAPYEVTIDAPQTTAIPRLVTVTYRAASAGQTLKVRHTVVTDYGSGNVGLQAATLQLTATGGATLTGTSEDITPTTVNLTAEGTADWAHWGLTTASSFNHKANITQQISNFTPIGTTAQRFAGNAAIWTSHSWSDGTPTASASATPALVYFLGTGNGYEFTAPADTTLRTLRVYLGGAKSLSQVEISLSDGSSAPYVTTIDATGSTAVPKLITLTYRAGSAGQTLKVRHTLTTDYGSGNLLLQAASLQLTEVGNASLNGSETAVPTTVNLTTEGTADWAHWGLTNASSFNHKSGVVQQISNITPVGTTAQRFAGNPAVWSSHSWSDGTPTASASGTPALVYFLGAGNGYEFTVPADTTERTLRVYLGGAKSLSQVEVSLSDGSAAPYVTTIDATGSTAVPKLITVTYRAASAGQTLKVRHILVTDYDAGNVLLQAASLQVTATNSPILTGSSAAVPTTVNLTTEGAADWAHWGLTNASSFNHKAGVTQQISNFTPFGTTALRFAGNPAVWPSHSWSNGTPTSSASGTPALVYFLGAGNSYEFTAPADTTQKTLRVYLGGAKSLSQVEISLSDDSATPYVTTIDATGSTAVPRLITVTYRAASAGQALKVRHTLVTDYDAGNLLLQAASLSNE